MTALWIVGEPGPDGGLARISTEVATLARSIAGEAGAAEVVGVVVAANPARAAEELARFVPRVLAIADPHADPAGHAWSTIAAERIAALVTGGTHRTPDVILTGAGPDGRDAAGVLAALLGWGVLGNAIGAAWSDGGQTIEKSVFGGKLIVTSGFTGEHGIVTVRPNVVTAEPLATAGTVDTVAVGGERSLPAVRVVGREEQAGAAVALEEAKVIVAGGRGVGGPDGFRLVEELATSLGGVVAASRAAVDSGWIPYSQQVGQTGKIVKPQLYVALGISGAIQHKVGMQGADTIVAINRDPDAPIAEFADMVVIGDLFQVVPAILDELRARSG